MNKSKEKMNKKWKKEPKKEQNKGWVKGQMQKKRSEFINNGGGERNLKAKRYLWINKMMNDRKVKE